MNKNNLWQYLQALPNKASEALLGKPVLDFDSIDLSGVDTTTPEFKENMGGVVDIKVSNNPRIGGLIPDIRAGYRENAYNPLKVENLGQDFGADGRKKGAGYRFGEFAGTAARLLDNPLVRGGIAYGLSKSMGDRRPLVEGLTAAVGTQQNRMKDQIYRKALADRKIDTSDIRGLIGDDTFKYLLEDQQLKDNAEYRNTYLETQRQNQALSNWVAQQKLEYDKISDAADRALKNRELDIKEKQAIGKPLSDTQVKNVKDLADSLNEANEIIAKYSNSKYDAGFGVVGAVRRNPLTSKFDPLASEMRQDIDLFRKTVARAKEGGRLTDQDQKYYEKAVLNPNLTRADFLSLANEFKNKMERQYDTALDMYELQGKNVNNFRNYYENNQTTTNEGWAF